LNWNGLPIVIFGTGGISREALHIIEEINNYNKANVYDFQGFIESDENKLEDEVTKGYKVVSCDSKFHEFVQKFKVLGVIIPIGTPKVKKKIFDKIKNYNNLVFPNIVHPNVSFDRTTVSFGFGNIIASGARLTNNIVIENFNLFNLNCTVGHDTRIKSFNVINPLASISGEVEISDCCLIGTGANILQQLKLQSYSIVGAGSVVTKDVLANEIVVGIPAKRLEIK
jgi:sugar O-acyltransferase (sialic acid O-acetyltransferase NeuD family)